MMICTAIAPRSDPTGPCEFCRHTNLLHRGQHNPDLDACMLCQLEQLLPKRQDPLGPFENVGQPPVLVHIVVGGGGWLGATLDQAAAHAKAREISGIVADLIASGDYRKPPAEGQ